MANYPLDAGPPGTPRLGAPVLHSRARLAAAPLAASRPSSSVATFAQKTKLDRLAGAPSFTLGKSAMLVPLFALKNSVSQPALLAGAVLTLGSPSLAIGQLNAAGWTTINPTAPFGQGIAFAGAGSRQIFVSSSTGNDNNAGTQAAPLATVFKGRSALRANSPDQLFLLCGDIWTINSTTDIGFGTNLPSGASAGVMGQICTGPMLISSYGTGPRPIVQINSGSQEEVAIGNFSAASGAALTFNNIAIIGIDFYAHKRDPNNAAYSYAEALRQTICVQMFGTQTPGATWTWVLFEDLRIRWFHDGFVLQPPAANSFAPNSIFVNRCVVTDSYGCVPSGAHAQGMFCNPGDNVGPYPQCLTVTESLFDANGWCAQLCQLTAVTIGGSTITWPTTPKFGNGAHVCPTTSGGGVTAWTLYPVTGLSGNSFTIGVALSAGAPTVWQWVETDIGPNANQYNRNFYIACPMVMTGVISARSAAEPAEFRQGGHVTNNLFVAGGCFVEFGHIANGFPPTTSGLFQNNVIIKAADIVDPSGVSTGDFKVNPNTGFGVRPRGTGLLIDNANTAAVIIDSNIVTTIDPASTVSNAYAIQVDNTCTGVTVTNNICFKWPGSGPGGTSVNLEDNGIGTHISGNFQDAAGGNNLGGLEPFPSPSNSIESYSTSIGGAGTLLDFLAQARLNSKQSWDPRYTAAAANNYIRAGFNR